MIASTRVSTPVSDDIFFSLPAWIRRGDGQLVPFDPRHISQGIFAATEALGQANAFLAREMTDSVVHFLAQEAGDEIPTTAQLGELIVKVVRELGQPALAQAYAEGREQQRVSGAATAGVTRPPEHSSPGDLSVQEEVQQCLRDYSLNSVYSRDLAAAFRDGLLVLTGLDKPAQLGGIVIEETEPGEFTEGRWWDLLVESHARAGSVVTCDSPECWWAPARKPWFDSFFKIIERESTLGAREVILNLHAASPARAKKAGASPLFGRPAPEFLPSAEWEETWVEHFLASGNPALRLDWHINGDDVRSLQAPSALAKLLNHPSAWNRVRWVFDRPRHSVALTEGLVRGQPGILGGVGLSLPHLASWPGVDKDPHLFLAKLPILARMGVAVGVQRRQYLRRQPALTRGFLVERSPWIVGPVGLDASVRLLIGETPSASKAALDFAQTVANLLATTVQTAARQAHLEVSLDGWQNQGADSAATEAWGFTTWDASASPRQQVQTAAALQASISGGTVWVLAHPVPADMWQLLQWAWKETRITRLAVAAVN